MKTLIFFVAFCCAILVLTIIACSTAQVNKIQSPKSISARARPFDPAAYKREQEGVRLLSLGYESLMSNPENAATYFRRAIPLSIVPDDALFGLAQALEQQGKSSEALAAYRSLTNPSTNWDSTLKREPRILMRYALLASQAGQWSEAVQAYETGREQHNKQRDSAQPPVDVAFYPQTPKPKELQAMAHLLLGAAYAKHGEREKALVHYEAAVKAEPRSALIQFYYGYGLRNAHRREEANAAFEKAASLGQGEVRAAAQKMRR